MKKLRLIIAIFTAKAISFVCSVLKSRGSSAPGKLALKIYPDFIRELSGKIKFKTIVVCGTNGKTTTNNLINSALLKSGYKTVCNNLGANMLSGIATAFSRKVNLFGKLDADYACFEVDEANMPLFLRQTKPDYIVVTNLFRDQLDRYGEIDATSKLLENAFLLAPNAQLILNSDDPVTSVFKTSKKNVYYKISDISNMRYCKETRYGNNCAMCKIPLSYEYYNYGQLGKYRCEKCGYENPTALYCAKNIKISDGILYFDIFSENESCSFESGITGLYNVYNTLAAYSILDILKIDKTIISKTISEQRPEPGRMSKFNIHGKTIYLILSKNTIGFNQSVTTVINDIRKKDISIILNDNPSDGVDISWIYEVDFKSLADSNALSYIVGGIRKYDLLLRFKYDDFDTSNIKIGENISDTISKMLSGSAKVCYALVNYTAMYPAYLELKRLEEEDKKNG